LLGLLIAGVTLDAQGSDPAADLVSVYPDVRRLLSAEEMPSIEKLPPTGGENLPPAGQAAEGPQFVAPLAEEVIVKKGPPLRLWKGSFELGLDGTEGNSQTLNFRFGFDAKRTTPGNVLKFGLDYRRNTTEEEETAHRAFLDWRAERLFHESPWTCFVHGTVDYDEFKKLDTRVAADLGLGYELIETDSTSLVAQLGGGFSHEIGSPNEHYVPEAVFGLDFEHQLTRRQQLACAVQYTPDVTDFGEFRLTARAGWELLIDQEMNLSLKLSVLNRYDSTPDGVKPNDLDYAAVLLWKF
jgi:putative salt-induced outer membrane protein YdiY